MSELISNIELKKADGAPIKREVIRQGIVSTEGLIW